MESRRSEGAEEEGAWDLQVRPAGSTWPPRPTSVVEIFRDLGHFITCDAPPSALVLPWVEVFPPLVAAGQGCPRPTGRAGGAEAPGGAQLGF